MTFTAPLRSAVTSSISEWTRDISAAPLHPQSAHVVEHLVLQTKVAAPTLNCYQYGLPIYEVSPDQPRVNIDWTGHTQAGDALYAGLLGLDPKAKGYPWPIPSYDILPPSVGAFRGVPIPPNVKPAVGTDRAIAIFCPATGEVWELWQARFNTFTGRWSAAWGGYIPDIRLARGQFPGTTGTSASGLALLPAVVTMAEARALDIRHAMSLAIPYAQEKVWSYPAVRCDGQVVRDPSQIPEGQRFRLDPSIDVTTLRTAPDWAGRTFALPPLTQAIARAAQKYGFIVTDTAGCVAIAAEEASGEMMMLGITENPWRTILQTKSAWSIMQAFPWDKLQALPFDWGKPPTSI